MAASDASEPVDASLAPERRDTVRYLLVLLLPFLLLIFIVFSQRRRAQLAR